MKRIVDIKDVQRELFSALCYFDDFCRKENITYFLSNGTLLGAVKYGKFVPWDDDVDLLLPREDYDKLVALSSINNDSYRLFCREQVPEWRMPYAKFSCENTLVEEGEYDFGARFGLSVDIFPIDTWSACRSVAKLQAVRSDLLKRLLVCSIGGDFKTRKSGVKKFILKSVWRRGKRLGHQRILKKINCTVEKSQTRRKKYAGCLAWTCHGSGEVLPVEIFEPSVSILFCGREFPTFKGYEAYLDSLYGAWREELPPDKQHSNHEIKAWWRNAE